MASAVTDPEAARQTFDSTNPATGAVVGTFPIHGAEEVTAAVQRAGAAARWWADLGHAERRRRLLAFKSILARRIDELAELMHAETGKPPADAFLYELIPAIEHLDWAARNARRVMRPRGVRPPLVLINYGASVEYRPLGVVGVIGPWNYPVHTPLGAISYALATGNAVVFKPSEYTPAIGRWLVDSFATVVPEEPVFTQVTGFGDTGQALCAAGVDKLAFTGSARTARTVMATCAERLTPVLIECGGNDAMIVADDADVDAAARAAVWGGMMHAGQTCIDVERVYVDGRVYDPFVERVTEIAARLRPGADEDASFGPMTMPRQVDVVAEHLRDALERGAQAVVGGPQSARAPYVDPVVLIEVPDDAVVLREETFGPVLPIVRVADADEAVRRANDSRYGLGAAVFSRRRGRDIADGLDAGMVSINGALNYAAIPALPWGGSGESGFGRLHGDDGLRAFTQAKAVSTKRFWLPDAMHFERAPWLTPVLKRTMRLLHGRS